VRDFFIGNALYWLRDYRFDGLRLDAVHAIEGSDFLLQMAGNIRHALPDRHIHLILENEENDATLLREAVEDQKFDAQWADDWHHCAHVLLTREAEGYYEDFRATRRRIMAASRAAGRARICRPPPSSSACRTTTRSATARWASGCAAWRIPGRCAPPSLCCCSRRRSR
jgi:maltooligosyltrehalose trehalohydrolase